MATTDLEVQPLEAGDSLTRQEFMRIWEMNPRIKLAELIGGRVYMPTESGAHSFFLVCGWRVRRF
jgi:hypothetical protein